MHESNYQFIHDTIVHWIDKADSKSDIIIALKLFILGYFITNFSVAHELNFKTLLFILYLVFSFSSFYWLVMIVFPKLSTGEASSMIYFKHISQKYKFNIGQGRSDFNSMSQESFKNDIINQIISLSIVSDSKYQGLRKGMIFLFLEIMALMLLKYSV